MRNIEYFAAHVDIPWNAVIETLETKFPEKKEKFTVQEVIEYRAQLKILEAKLMINALNQEL